MTQQLHEGQEVEVYYTFSRSNEATWPWVKGKIVGARRWPAVGYLVKFPDGTCDVFNAELIRLSKEQIEQELIKNGERFLDAMGEEVKP
jgi:hypothetical protein